MTPEKQSPIWKSTDQNEIYRTDTGKVHAADKYLYSFKLSRFLDYHFFDGMADR